jgi:hypothetical protein
MYTGLEAFYTTLLVLAFLAIVATSVVVLLNLFRGQR